MPGQLLPPPELAPNDLSDLPIEKRVAVWLDMLNVGYKLVLAGLRHEIGPDGDINAAYREWYAKEMDDHDRVVKRMLLRMQQRRPTDAR